MPIVKTAKINEKSIYAIWKITENVEELRKLAQNTANVQLPDKNISNETKKMEWIAGRLLLASLVNEVGRNYAGIYKDEYGKPYLKGLNYQISLTHSFPLVAAIIHEGKAVGIDVEQPKEKLLNIAHKFLSEEEQEICGNDIELLCTFWCAKESIYKLYGKKRLIFKENLRVNYRVNGEEKCLSGKVILNDTTEEYKLQAEKINNSLLVFTI